MGHFYAFTVIEYFWFLLKNMLRVEHFFFFCKQYSGFSIASNIKWCKITNIKNGTFIHPTGTEMMEHTYACTSEILIPRSYRTFSDQVPIKSQLLYLILVHAYSTVMGSSLQLWFEAKGILQNLIIHSHSLLQAFSFLTHHDDCQSRY